MYPQRQKVKDFFIKFKKKSHFADFLTEQTLDFVLHRLFCGLAEMDTDTAKTESKTAQAQMLILELLADGKRMPSAELEKTVNERGISSRTMRTATSRIGDRLVTEKDGTAWVCYLRD